MREILDRQLLADRRLSQTALCGHAVVLKRALRNMLATQDASGRARKATTEFHEFSISRDSVYHRVPSAGWIRDIAEA